MLVIETQPDSFEALERRAEFSLLCDFIIQTPKMGNMKVMEYIENIEGTFVLEINPQNLGKDAPVPQYI